MSFKTTRSREPSITRYLEEISLIPLMTPEEEIACTQEIRRGNHSALEKLTKANLRFVVSVAKQYQNQGLPLGDLINAGNLGLLKAAMRFDETRGFKFISYAVWWIRQSILQALAEQSRIVRLPLNRISMLNKIERILNELEQTYQREPLPHEIAEVMKIDITEAESTLEKLQSVVSLEAGMSQDDENRLIDVLESDTIPSPEDKLLEESLSAEIEEALNSLPPREAQVLRLYFGFGCEHAMTLEEIGEHLKLTRERVRQIKEKAIERLRRKDRSRTLRKYLGQ